MTSYEFHENDLDAIARVLRRGDLDCYGEAVRTWEAALAQTTGCRAGLATGSGTSALILALRAAGIAPGNWVALPSLTFCATAQAVLAVGGRPVLLDVDPHLLVITPKSLEPLPASTRLAGLIVVDLFGNLADLDALAKATTSSSPFILEDAAQAFGSARARAPQDGRTAAMSFNGGKQLGIGQGGALVSDDEALIARARILRHNGLERQDGAWVATVRGANHLFDGVRAALAVSLLSRIDEHLRVRERVTRSLDDWLAKRPGLRTQAVTPGSRRVAHRWVLRFDDLRERAEVMKRAKERGFGLHPFYPPLHVQPLFEGAARAGSLEATERFAADSLVLELKGSDADRQVLDLIGLFPVL